MSNKRSRRPTRTEPTASEGIIPILLAALRGTGLACLIGALLLLAGTAIAYAQDDPDSLITPLGLVVAALTAFLAGAFAARRARRAVLLCGLFCGGILLLLSAALALIPVDDPTPLNSTLSLIFHAVEALLCIAGAYLGRRRARR